MPLLPATLTASAPQSQRKLSNRQRSASRALAPMSSAIAMAWQTITCAGRSRPPACLAGVGQDLLHPAKSQSDLREVGRECPGDHAEADGVADTNAARKAGGNTRPPCQSQKTRPVM